MIISPHLKQKCFMVLDKVQAFELCDSEKDHNEFVLSLLPETRELYRCSEVYKDSVMLENQIQKIESLLNNRYSTCNGNTKRDIMDFVTHRRNISYIEDIIGEMNIRERENAGQLRDFKKEFQEFKDYLLDNLVTDKNPKCNPSVTNTVTTKQRTVNGKLVKEHSCAVCENVFNSHRKDALYCSVKCKQMAYRSRKST